MQDEFSLNQSANPELIAYRLMVDVLAAEGRQVGQDRMEGSKVSRNLILDAYADCLEAVMGKREKRPIRRVA